MRVPGPCLISKFGSLIGRFNSLFDHLGNFRPSLRYFNDFPGPNRAPSGSGTVFCRYFPVDREIYLGR